MIWSVGETERWDTAPAEAKPKKARRAGPLKLKPTPLRRRLSPSGLEGGQQVLLEERLRSSAGGAMAFGTAIHALFETIEWLGPELPETAELGPLIEPEVGPEGIDRTLDAFEKMLSQPEVRKALTAPGDSQMRTVLREHRFAVETEEGLLSGSFDRLELVGDPKSPTSARLVDFKTDSLGSADPSVVGRRIEYYRPQVEAYRLAVQKLWSLEARDIEAGLLFVSAGIYCSL